MKTSGMTVTDKADDCEENKKIETIKEEMNTTESNNIEDSIFDQNSFK